MYTSVLVWHWNHKINCVVRIAASCPPCLLEHVAPFSAVSAGGNTIGRRIDVLGDVWLFLQFTTGGGHEWADVDIENVVTLA